MRDLSFVDENDDRDILFLLAIMECLRTPETGCPWDLEQTFATIAPHTLEEAYEVVDAIEQQDMDALKDELGDLLFQVVFYARLGQEKGFFDFGDIVQAINQKMIRRHPNIFSQRPTEDSQTQNRLWEEIKEKERQEKKDQTQQESILSGIASSLPALTRAKKLQERAARVGFDWETPTLVLEKVLEEIDEIRVEIETQGSHDRLEDEMGDVLFACTNLARKLKIDPESALRRSNTKFERRFHHIEQTLGARGCSLHNASLVEMEALWEDAKHMENSFLSHDNHKRDE